MKTKVRHTYSEINSPCIEKLKNLTIKIRNVDIVAFFSVELRFSVKNGFSSLWI